MNFSDVLRLDEKWMKTVPINTVWTGKLNLDIFENPNMKDIREIMHKHGQIRIGVTDSKTPKLYIWSGNILHKLMHKKHVKFDLGLHTQHINPPFLHGDRADGWKSWDEIKNKKEVFKAIRKSFPRVSEITYYSEFGYEDSVDFEDVK